ncbi:hypothetical protein SPRG_05826 [Saprolegnia parasitica CBS 223.65]|uniref:Uncharacterized protein n=1 Tax=Saprolegnia parasitica (strain CBS 223.65) TaxID=695850 RepID=A0A067CEW5_SAPPC|nr:hypothetical protein SPRG_05826 [Saprolegnia parasitica CBS 223.65]KDO29289.1 hypothetical protein SPRG_05826 [Saprolegnia parasitica CBS 223.65]|eukprot:XP_012199797.1 hypothetical protein SPRG_05826 [Saprolegnia parasitica CBS 223.65]
MIRVDTTTESTPGPPANLLQYPTKSMRVNRLQTRHEGSASPASKAVQSSRLLDFFFGPVQQQKPKLKSNVGPRMNAMESLDRSLSPSSRSRRGNYQAVTQSLDRRGLVRQQTYAGHEAQRPPMTDVDRRRENNSAPITQTPYQAPTSVFATQPRHPGLKKAQTMEVSQFGKIKAASAAQDRAGDGHAPRVYKRAGGDHRKDDEGLDDAPPPPPMARSASGPDPRRADTSPERDTKRSSREDKQAPHKKRSEHSSTPEAVKPVRRKDSNGSKPALEPPKYHHVSSQNASWMDGIVDDDVTLDCLTPVSCILAQSYDSAMSPRSSLDDDYSLYSPRSTLGRETDDYEEVLRKYQQEAKAPPPQTKNVVVEFEF